MSANGHHRIRWRCKCHWTEHVNDQCRFETKYKTVENEYDEIKSRYYTALQGQSKFEAVLT